MNEPDEELERHVPEEPLPERDVLLEALVDREKQAAPRRRISKTLIAACLLTGFGVWQIVHVSNGGKPIFRVAAKAKAAPTKLRSDGRRPIGKALPSTDPIASYLERAKRGMTDQEIRWMVADFQAAGLDQVDRSLKGTLRVKQQLWYLEALTEALQLSPEQKAQAKASMESLLAKDIEAIDKSEAKDATIPADLATIPTDLDLSGFDLLGSGFPFWLTITETFSPWRLVELNEQQSAVTMRKWVTSTNGEPVAPIDPFGTSRSAGSSGHWINPAAIAMQDPISGNLIEYPPPSALDFACTMHGTVKGGIMKISDVLPLTPDQKLADHRIDLAAQARLLQPAQLRLALLFTPGLSSTILQQLDSPPSRPEPNTDPGIVNETPEEPAPITTSPADELPPNTVEPETSVDPLPKPDPK